MTAIRVWSEQGEAKWRDCMQAAYLMVQMYGGATIPNPYTVSERERFENNEGLPESEQEQGLFDYGRCDVASRKLYGVVAHGASEGELAALLAIPGVGLALTGRGAGLPGVPAYPSGYQNNHSVTVLPLGNGKVAVYDPLNSMNAGPGIATVSAILAWHRNLTYPRDIRYTREDEFAMISFAFTGPPIGTLDVEANPNVRGKRLDTGELVKITPGPQPVYQKLRLEIGMGPESLDAWTAYVNADKVAILARNGVFTPALADQATIDRAVNAATTPLTNKIDTAVSVLRS